MLHLGHLGLKVSNQLSLELSHVTTLRALPTSIFLGLFLELILEVADLVLRHPLLLLEELNLALHVLDCAVSVLQVHLKLLELDEHVVQVFFELLCEVRALPLGLEVELEGPNEVILVSKLSLQLLGMFLGFLEVILNLFERLELEFKTLELQNALSFEVQIFLELRFLFNVLLFEVYNDYLQILDSSEVDLNVSLHLSSPLDYVFDVLHIKLHFIKCFLKPPVLLEVTRLLYLLS
jgi:hypothetical protein